VHLIAENAAYLGTPNLQIIHGVAPKVLVDLPEPDAIFMGGGVHIPRMLETCWQALKPRGRLVVNAVTVASESLIFNWQQQVGGSLRRIAIQRAEPLGSYLAWRSLAPVTQWHVIKPLN
jgi:precorrin-6Y C5,15-methyltransferase (decarboxylating)